MHIIIGVFAFIALGVVIYQLGLSQGRRECRETLYDLAAWMEKNRWSDLDTARAARGLAELLRNCAGAMGGGGAEDRD